VKRSLCQVFIASPGVDSFYKKRKMAVLITGIKAARPPHRDLAHFY